MTFARAAATTLALGLALLAGIALAQPTTEITFYYPIAVGGPITRIVDGYAEQFSKEHPSIRVKPVYTGTYQESIVKALTAYRSGEPPTTAILLSTDMFTLIDEDAIVPWDELAKAADEEAWMKAFFPAFMKNSQTGGKTWGIPFQRSTIVLYWNKEIFKEAGLDPNKPPATWAEQVELAKKLTKRDASGNVTRWGVQVPSSGFPYWLFQGFTTQNDVLLMNEAGTQTHFDDPKVIEALQYWVDLSARHKVMAPGVIEWGTTPKDFFEKKTAMMWTTTGNLTNVRNNAKFEFGVAMLPAGKHRGSPTGGGNFYVFKKAPAAQQQAAVKFARWMTSPERAAHQIIRACRYGDAELIITIQARMAVLARTAAPELFADTMAVIDQLLPGPSMSDGDESRPGRESESDVAGPPAPLTAPTYRAAEENNEM